MVSDSKPKTVLNNIYIFVKVIHDKKMLKYIDNPLDYSTKKLFMVQFFSFYSY